MIKSKKLDLSYIWIIESIIWMHFSKKKIKKLDDRFWKSIHVSYEDEISTAFMILVLTKFT